MGNRSLLPLSSRQTLAAIALCLGGSGVACEPKKQNAAPQVEVAPTTEEASAEPSGQVAIPEPATQPPVNYEVSDVSDSQAQSTPSPLAVSAVSVHGDVSVRLENFSYFCSPKPAFAERKEDRTLILQVIKPNGAVTRCISAINQTMTFKGIDSDGNLEKVEIRDAEGLLRVSGAVTKDG